MHQKTLRLWCFDLKFQVHLPSLQLVSTSKMQSLRTGLDLVFCSILLGTYFVATEISAVTAAPLGEEENEVRTLSTEENDRAVFRRLVEEVKFDERVVTIMEKTAKCPYKTLTFGGVTHVMCDFSQCREDAPCQKYCHQGFAFLKGDTHSVTKEEPGGEYQRVYFGCIYENEKAIQSAEPPVVS